MATVASIVTSLRANTGHFDAAMNKAGATLHQFQMRSQSAHAALAQLARVEMTPQLPATFRQLNDELKSILGRGSAFNDFLEIAMGGGAIAGLNMLTSAFGNMGKSLTELAAASLKAGANMNDMMSKFVSSIPVVGGIHDAATGVFNAIDVAANGQNAAINQAAMTERQAARTKGLAGFGQQAAEQLAAAQDRRGQVGLVGADAIRMNAMVQNAAIERELSRKQDEMIAQFGESITTATEFLALRVAANADKEANSAQARAAIAEIEVKTKDSVQQWIVKNIESKTKAVTSLLDTIGGAVGGGAGAVAGAVSARMEQDAERRQRAADKEAKQAEAARRSFIGDAASIYGRLKDQNDSSIRFGGAAVLGGQEEYAMRQRSLFGGQVAKSDTSTLLREAVAEAKKQLEEQKRTNDLLGQIYDEEGVEV